MSKDSKYQYDSVYPNHGARIDESKFNEEGAVRLENGCVSCGAISLYAHKSPIGYYIACASEGCNIGYTDLIKRAEKHRLAFYKERGINYE